MSDYAFYAAHLRFIARTTDRSDPAVAAMMEDLGRVAEAVERRGAFTVPADRLRTTARALAGVAGFLQQHILPETVSAGNAVGEAQVRWVIDTSMEAMAVLMSHAEVSGDATDRVVDLPPPPAASSH